MSNLFENDDLRVQLADRMGANPDDFEPLVNPTHDYEVLIWMRHTVKAKWPDTYVTFVSYISGAMHGYSVGDYARGAMLAIGIINSNKTK